MTDPLDQQRMRRLVEVGRALLSELDPDALLDRILETAREITGARYAALGILNSERTELERFLTQGVDEDTQRAIGDLPRGRGVLGVLIDEPRPLRLTDVGRHPRSYGFPSGHPVMRSFLGVPIVVRGETWGNLYLAETPLGEFTEGDEEAAVVLADWAAIAIDNARTLQTSEQRRSELERAMRGLEATRDIAVAIGDDVGLERVLELIVKRGRALVEARSVVIMLREGSELVVAAYAGHAVDAHGKRLSIADSTSGQVLKHGRAERITDIAARLRIAPGDLGVPDAHAALLVPLVYRGEPRGLLAAFDRGESAASFTEDDEQVLRTFAASAATAVATAQSVMEERLRHSLAAADAERRRWARELHDETLQGLGAMRVLLATALRRAEPRGTEEAMRQAIEQLEQEITSLRSIITELRPAALDELGLRPAIEALIQRHRNTQDFALVAELALHGRAGDSNLDPEIETTVYRLVQEALTNVAKHAGAHHVRVAITEGDDELMVAVEDDGGGFSTDERTEGFGLAGMRERVYLSGGTITIQSPAAEGGTLVEARLPVRRVGDGRAAQDGASGRQQAAS